MDTNEVNRDDVDARDEAADVTASAAVPPPPIPAPAPAPEARPAGPVLRKNPLLAGFLSFFPGLGHVYNGLYARGVVFFLLFFACIQLGAETDAPLFAAGAAFTWLFCVLDSYRQASLINLGLATDLGALDRPSRLSSGPGFVGIGVGMFAIGLLELLERVHLWDWDWLAEYWFVFLMLVGAALVASGLRDRRKNLGPGEDAMAEGIY